MTCFQAYDQPDVYETADLPESDQNTGFYEVMNMKCGTYLFKLLECKLKQTRI
jgi:hypothetical protein